jgi:hypothetical protein
VTQLLPKLRGTGFYVLSSGEGNAKDEAESQAMSPEVKVKLARRVPRSVAYNKIRRDREIVR